MLKSYKECVRISSIMRTNKVFSVMSGIPLVNKIFKSGEQAPASFMKNRVITEIIYFVWEIIKVYAYVLLFIHMPKVLFSKYMATGSAGFGLDDAYVYFMLILTCCAGSIIHSKLFDVNEESYTLLKVLRIQPKVYFRTKLVSRAAIEMVTFWSILVILGMGPGKAMFMALIVVFSRMVGECFNILVFKMTKKSFNDIKSAPVIVMLMALLLAYFVPYVRGYVPSAYDLIFNPVTMFIILAVGSFIAYFVWNNDSYNKITARLYIRKGIEYVEEKENICESIEAEEVIGTPEDNPYTGYKYMANLFFNRNRSLFVRINVLKGIIIGAVFVVAMMAANFGYIDTVKKVISYSMPIMVFVMYCLCDVTKICKTMFYQHDRYILRNNISVTDRMEDFLYRLGRLMKINAIPVVMLILAYVIMGILVLDADSMNNIIYLSVSIAALGVLFTVFGLAIYYIFQPYNDDAELAGHTYMIVSIIMYFVGYGCVYIRTSGVIYMTGIVVATGLTVIGAVTLIYKVSGHTFKIRK